MEKLKTYVDGFDEKLGGGIPEKSVVLIAGAPGTMKSSLAYSILYNNALNGVPSLYFGFEQGDIPGQMHVLGFDYTKVKEKLSVVDIGQIRYAINDQGPPSRERRSGKADMLDLEFYLQELRKIKRRLPYQILVIDSLDALESIADIKNRRYELFYLFKWLRELGATIFLISEAEPGVASGPGYEEGYLADGIVRLVLQDVNEVESQRRIRCLKMRGTKHSTDYLALMYEKGKFQVTDLMRH